MGSKKNRLIKELSNFKQRITNVFDVKRMILFGSMAGGKIHKWSDVDLIIVGKKFEGLKFYKRSIGLYDYWDLKYPVDFICYTPKEFEKLSKQITIVSQALKEGIEI